MKILQQIRKIKRPSQLHFEILLVFVKLLDTKDIRGITETFQSLDFNAKGHLEQEELIHGYRMLNDQLNVKRQRSSMGSFCDDAFIDREQDSNSDSPEEHPFKEKKVRLKRKPTQRAQTTEHLELLSPSVALEPQLGNDEAEKDRRKAINGEQSSRKSKGHRRNNSREALNVIDIEQVKEIQKTMDADGNG